MSNEVSSDEPNSPRRNLCRNWWLRLVTNIKRCAHEKKAKKKNEYPSDRAARRTTNATIWIAVFTVALVCVSGLQFYEMHSAGAQTDKLICIAQTQAYALVSGNGAFLVVPWIEIHPPGTVPDKPNAPIKASDVPQRGSVVNIAIENDGKYPATMVSESIGWAVERLPPDPDYHPAQPDNQTVPVGKAGTGTSQFYRNQDRLALSDNDIAAIERGAPIWIYGTISYLTLVDTPVTVGFSFHRTGEQTRFSPNGFAPDRLIKYDYRRQENSKNCEN